MYEYYETVYQIHNHLSSNSRDTAKPLASVAMHPCENYTEGSAMYDSLTLYAEMNYKEVWGLSVVDYLNLPAYFARMLREITAEVNEKKRKAIESVEQNLAAELSGNKK